MVACTSSQKEENKEITFVSFPDFFNFDVPEPWGKWDSAVDFFLNEVSKENPDFVLIAGDLVNGHWWDSPECVEQMGTLYYSGWKRRVEKHGLKYYTAVGDHELDRPRSVGGVRRGRRLRPGQPAGEGADRGQPVHDRLLGGENDAAVFHGIRANGLPRLLTLLPPGPRAELYTALVIPVDVSRTKAP